MWWIPLQAFGPELGVVVVVAAVVVRRRRGHQENSGRGSKVQPK